MFSVNDSINTLNNISINDVAYMDAVIKTLQRGMYDANAAQTLVTNINKLLSVGHTREKGLEVLFHIIPDCSMTILQEYSIPWTNHVLNYHPKEAVSVRRFNVLCEILDLCHDHQDYNKVIVNNILAKIIEMCLSVHKRSKECNFALECICKCLKYFPTTMIVYKKKLETFLIAIMDTPVTTCVMERAAKCMLYLNQTGGSGSLGSMHIKNYNDYVCKLTNTLDKLYDSLYETTNEYSEHESDHSNVYEFREIPPSLGDNEKLRILEQRLKSVSLFITKAIELSYPVKKTIKPEMLLSVIQRGLAVHVHIEEGSLNNIILSTVIHNHQVYLLEMVKTCITCFKENFTRFSTIKIVLDYLQRTENCKCFKGRSEYKIAIYEILEYWILNCSEFLDPVTYDKIIKHIISDITPVKNSVLLHVNPKNKQKPTKDKQTINSLPLRLQFEHENICYQALRTLHTLLQKVLLTIKDNTCTVLFETLMKNLFDVSVNLRYNPYTSKKNCVLLYKVLIAIFDQQRKSLDMGLAVNILNIGLSNFDVDIANVCSEGLMALEKICQPTHLSLSLNILDDDNIEQMNGEKRNEDRNQTDKIVENNDYDVTEIEDEEDNSNSFEKNDDECCVIITELSTSTDNADNKDDFKVEENILIIEENVVPNEEKKEKPIIVIDNAEENCVIKVEEDVSFINEAKLQNIDSVESKEENEEKINVIDDDDSVGNDDMDLQLVDSDKCEDDEETPPKKVKLNNDNADEKEIDVVGEDEDVEDLLSSFVDEVQE